MLALRTPQLLLAGAHSMLINEMTHPALRAVLRSLSGQADTLNYSLELSDTSEYSTAQENKETASLASNSLTRFFLLTVFFGCLFFILALAALQYGNNIFCNTQECNKHEFGGGNTFDSTV